MRKRGETEKERKNGARPFDLIGAWPLRLHTFERVFSLSPAGTTGRPRGRIRSLIRRPEWVMYEMKKRKKKREREKWEKLWGRERACEEFLMKSV